MAKDFSKKADEMLASTLFCSFLGKENVEDLKKGIKNALLDHFVSDIEQYPYYLMDEGDVREVIEDVLKELKKEIITEYKDQLKEALFKAILKGLDVDSIKEFI